MVRIGQPRIESLNLMKTLQIKVPQVLDTDVLERLIWHNRDFK
jgi:hypothetical protein